MLFVWFIETFVIHEVFVLIFSLLLLLLLLRWLTVVVAVPFPFHCFWCVCVCVFNSIWFCFYSTVFGSIPYSVDTERFHVFYTLLLFPPILRLPSVESSSIFVFVFVEFYYAHLWWYQSHFHCVRLLSPSLLYAVYYGEPYFVISYLVWNIFTLVQLISLNEPTLLFLFRKKSRNKNKTKD